MLPSTKRCRARLAALNEKHIGAELAEEFPEFYDEEVRYKVLAFERYEHAVHDTDRCQIRVVALNSVQNFFPWAKHVMEGQEEVFGFSIDDIEKLFSEGSLEIRSHIAWSKWRVL